VLAAVDIVLIHQLLARYGDAIDRRDWEAFAELFTPDATIDYTGGTGVTQRNGRDDIVDWFRDNDEGHPPAHHVTNIIVDERADPAGRVDVHSKFFVPFTRDHQVPKRMYGGDYHDVVTATPGGWRFAHKECTPCWQLAVVVDESAPAHRKTY